MLKNILAIMVLAVAACGFAQTNPGQGKTKGKTCCCVAMKGACCKDGKCTDKCTCGKKDGCCKDGKCSKECKKNDCCKSGHCCKKA